MEVSVIGINHRTAPVHVRERVSLPGELALELLRTIRRERIFEEALVLDTCNRTEMYCVTDQLQGALPHLLEHIADLRGTSPLSDTSVFYRYDGLSAVRHLFRVCASLDSQIVGEHEILGQVKAAYRVALEAQTARFLLNRLMHWAFRVAKRVQTETDLGRGTASVPQAAVELAGQIFSTLQGKTVLLVGAGQTAQLAARALIRSGADSLIVANRTLNRAQQLAGELLSAACRLSSVPQAGSLGVERARRICPALQELAPECSADAASAAAGNDRPAARAVDLAQIPLAIADADLVICSTGSLDFVLDYDVLAGRLGRIDHPLLIVDIAVPRDADPRLGELPNVFLYNIDDLDCLVAEHIERRRLEIPRAEAIVEWEVQQFDRWLQSLQVVPTIKLLKQRFDSLQEAEIKRYGKNFSSSERRELEKFAQGLCKKILHGPISFLRELSNNHFSSDDLAAVDLVRRIFELDSPERDG